MRTLQAWCAQCAFEKTKDVDLRGKALDDAAEAFKDEVAKRHASDSNESHVIRVQYTSDPRQDPAGRETKAP